MFYNLIRYKNSLTYMINSQSISFPTLKNIAKIQAEFKHFAEQNYDLTYIAHPWHIVDKSPWPFLSGFSAFFFTFGLVLYMYGFSIILLLIGFLSLIMSFYLWSKDVVREGTFHGKHTTFVQNSLKTGFIYFIVSEFMLFFSFFWTLYNFYFIGSLETSYIYPPYGLHMDTELPSIMNLILILSGLILNLSHIHFKLKLNNFHLLPIQRYLMATIFLGFLFVELQAYEYINNSFTFSDSTFGSVFYILTGCHSLHVIIGVTFLLIAFIRTELYHTTLDHNLNYDLSVWYWHFVDVIWIFLYFKVYYFFYYLEKLRLTNYKHLMYVFGDGSAYFTYFYLLQKEYFENKII